MKSVQLAFAVHNHQPIGNFESVFEEAYQRSYLPFLDVLERHPGIRFTQHWTGTLLEWLLVRHPGFVARLRALVERGQLELLTGAYYEAVLAIIPEADRLGQVKKLTGAVQANFSYTPRGMWLAERVWEQSLVSSLVSAGVEFVVVDDTHFRHAGLRDEQLLGYYVTENLGDTLNVLPIDKTMRYAVPFRPVEESIQYLRQVAGEDGRTVVVHADDGEKFGVWPKTHKHVYEDGWLESFCKALEDSSSWINTTHLGTILDTQPPLGRIYLPTASYSEMMKWALDSASFMHLERFEQNLKESKLFETNAMFVRGGFWRNFLAKYPEANHMHKKMLRISKRAEKLSARMEIPGEVMDHLWAGQCNDPYWHGVFGGLYLPNLRYPVYHNLLLAEVALDKLESPPEVCVEQKDFDCDGHGEILVESKLIDLYLKPSSGGSLVELDFKPAAFNLLDIVSRREEGYHHRLRAKDRFRDSPSIHEGVLVKESGLEGHLHYDWYRHASLIDHFFGEGTTLDAVARCAYHELGDFVNQPYRSSVKETPASVEVTLERQGALWFEKGVHRLTVRKVVRYRAGTNELEVEYTLVNEEKASQEIWFGVEWNVGLMAGDAHDRYYVVHGRSLSDKRLRSMGEEREVTEFALVDEWLKVRTGFTASRPATLWRFPIETVSLSESGFERLFQSSVIVPNWKITLEREFAVRFTQSISQI
jgi:hypothetical protein